MDILIRQRGGHRGLVTSLINKVDVALAETPPDITMLDGYKTELENQQHTLSTLDDRIQESLDTDQKMSDDISKSSEIRIKILYKIGQILRLLEVHAMGSEHQSSNHRGGGSNGNVRLPPLTLSTFDGNPMQWPAFWDLFNSAIHERNDLSSSAKFHYLISQLRGDAQNLLAGFDHTDAEYDEAVELLTNTYGKSKLIIQARLHAVFDLDPPEASSTALSRFRAAYEGHLRALKSLGCNITDSGYIYAALLMRKLPRRLADNINRATNSDSWTLEELRRAIDDEIILLRAAEPSSDIKDEYLSLSSASFHVNIGNKSDPKDSSKNVKTTRNFSIKCGFCASDLHYSTQCEKFSSYADRINRVKTLRLCFNCLLPGHAVSNCKNNHSCRNCKKRHHTSICRNENLSNPTALSVSASDSFNSGNILPTALINLDQNGNHSTIALFDGCSQKSFVTSSLVDKLNLHYIDETSLSLDGFQSTGNREKYPIVSLPVYTPTEVINVSAIVVNSLPERLFMNGRSESVRVLSKMNLNLADPTCDTDLYNSVSVLIGVDNYYKFVYAQKIIDDLYLIPSKLGNMIAGNVTPKANISVNLVSTILKVSCDRTQTDIENLWKMDKIGIDDTVDESHEDHPAIIKFKQTLTYENGKYCAGLPWKEDPRTLPTNYNMAMSRMLSVVNSLRKVPKNLEKYHNVIKDQLKSDYIEIVENSELTSTCHYLPHHAVMKESNTTPLRVVFDCSAKTAQCPLSLNDCLYSGPPLLNDLCSVLLRFRLNGYCCTADIAKAFLQIGLKSADRDFTRFLWPVDPFDTNSPVTTYRFKSVLFGSTSSQFLLMATLMHHLERDNSWISNKILRDLYVDNLISTFKYESDLVDFYCASRKLLSDANFNLREWSSNSKLLNDMLPSHESTSTKQKILGLNWDTETDLVTFPIKTSSYKKITKREVVSRAAEIYDPLGYLLPVTIRARLFIQKLWVEKIGWELGYSIG